MNIGLDRLRKIAITVLVVIVTGAMLDSFIESFHGLYLWATGHRVHGYFAYTWPLMIDSFLLSGEIILLTSAIGSGTKKTRSLGWFMTLGGLAASVMANGGQVGAHAALTDHATGAVPPLAAFASMVAAISLIKQTVTAAEPTLEAVCMHTVGGSSEADIKNAYLHGRDCLGKTVDAQRLADAYRTPLPVVQTIVNKIKQQEVIRRATAGV
jgi:hypothetical protein